jgi:ribonuclease Z
MQSRLRFFGTSAAVPSLKRGFSCIGLIQGDEVTIFDCGDGSLRKILAQGTDVLSIPRVLITHYHSDHLSGIVQIIETMGIRKRSSDLEVYGPKGLVDYFSTVERITHVAANRRFKIKLHELAPGDKVKFDHFSVAAYEMVHTIPCIAYRVDSDSFSVGYTGDTEPCDQAVALGRDCEFLIHEATYLQRDRDKARVTKHSTAQEAGEDARKAGAKNLILTHVNDDLESEDEMIAEATKFHERVRVAHDEMEINLSS